jgi:hypothetical protein
VTVVRLLAGVLAIALLIVGVDTLSDATQNRPDDVEAGTRSEVVFDVTLRQRNRAEAVAADTLWSVCAGTITHATTLSGPTGVGDEWKVTVEPALGEHSRRRLVGCLEDATIDGVLGRVLNLTPHPS